MDINEKLEEFLPIIDRVARRVAGEHYVVEKDDLEQELIVFVIKRLKSENAPLPLPSEKKMNTQSFLTSVARMYAFEQKQQHYLIDSNISYEMKDVRELLQTHFEPDLWDAVREGESVEERVVAHSDIAWALDRLSAADRTFVAECYRSEQLPRSGTKEYRRLRDVIIKMTNMLNHWTRSDEGEGPGRRRAMSNATANATIDSLS